jgi:hypothetical protein
VKRGYPRIAALTLLAVVLNGCATYVPRPPTNVAAQALEETTSTRLIGEWQERVARHIALAGGGDPAVLSQLPGLRSPSVLRPGQIVFGANDIDSSVAERDGYDVFGLLVGKRNSVGGSRYVFIVGTVQRRNYRSVAVADIRVTTLSMHKGTTYWQTGDSDKQALARYRASADPATAVRFPADRDQFRMVACPDRICVDDMVSGARWSLYLDPSVAGASGSPDVASAATTR